MHLHDIHIKAVCKLLRSCAYRHDLHDLFSDCMEAIAISLSNSVDHANRDRREKRYLEIVGRYDRDVIEMFPKVLGEIVLALEAGPGDVLGAIYAELELGSKDRGQFFTPYSVCQMMATAILGTREQTAQLIERNGFVRAMEPACGAGAMVIALAEALRAAGFNYQGILHVSAVDIDTRAAHMAYIQFTLLHIPAIVIVGNSLSLEVRDRWYTLAHILGGWSAKLARREAEEAASRLIEPPVETAPPLAPSPAAHHPLQLSLF